MHLLFLFDLPCLAQVDLEVVRNQWMESGEVFDQIYQAADLYGIFEDLFQYAYFWPCLMLQVEWLQEDGETLVPVHRGNLVKPGECKSAPEVSYFCLVATVVKLLAVTCLLR